MTMIDSPPAYRPLTPGQRRFLWCIWCWTTRNGRPPTYLQLMDALGWGSTNYIHELAKVLVGRGWLLPHPPRTNGTHLRLAGMRMRQFRAGQIAELLTDHATGRLTYEAERLERDVIRNGGQ